MFPSVSPDPLDFANFCCFLAFFALASSLWFPPAIKSIMIRSLRIVFKGCLPFDSIHMKCSITFLCKTRGMAWPRGNPFIYKKYNLLMFAKIGLTYIVQPHYIHSTHSKSFSPLRKMHFQKSWELHYMTGQIVALFGNGFGIAFHALGESSSSPFIQFLQSVIPSHRRS